MAYDFYKQSGLEGILKGYQEGKDWRQNRQLKENEDIRRANEDLRQSQEFALGQGFVKPVYDGARLKGYEEDPDAYARNKDLIFSNLPHLAPKEFRNAQSKQAQPTPASTIEKIVKSVDDANSTPEAEAQRKKDREAMIARMKAAGTLPSNYVEQPQKQSNYVEIGPQLSPGDPPPLLRDHAANADAKAKITTGELNATGGPVSIDKKTASNLQNESDYLVANKDTGKLIKQGAVFTEDLPVTGDIPASGEAPLASAGQDQAQGAVEQPQKNYNPNPYMMHLLSGVLTQKPLTESDPLIPIQTLPAALKSALGLENEQGAIRRSILERMMIGQQKNTAAVSGINQKAIPYIQSIENGMDVSDAMAQFSADGNTLDKETAKAFLNAERSRNTKTRIGQGDTRIDQRDRGLDLAERKYGSEEKQKISNIASGFSKVALAKTLPDIEAINVANTVNEMLDRKDTNGLAKFIPMLAEKMFVNQRLTNYMIGADPGLQGLDYIEQWITKYVTGELTDKNIGFFKKQVADAVKEKLANIRDKKNIYFTSGVGALTARGVDPEDATSMMEDALKGLNQENFGLRSSNGEIQKLQDAAKKLPVVTTEADRAKLLVKKQAATQRIMNNVKDPVERRKQIKALNDKFNEIMKSAPIKGAKAGDK